MRNFKFIAIVAVLATVAFGCSNKAQEKKIADLEEQVAQLKSNTSSTVKAATPEPEVKPEGPLPSFKFEEELHDFGTINEGDIAEHVFTFVNDGEAPLIISNAKGSCGCTVPEWPKEPIGVGEKGQLKVKFNSKKKPGAQSKTVTITANTYPSQTKIKIKAQVTPAPKEEEAI
ncbi:DUF1573 domain-containing protein [Reichenbachiella versicolor]|uniref:DUF1573 domain-containing protein n=1 Tax=Reichenbachiella versicolor TaxID=1821036 RepID=UPI000D6E359C|nr:DUF1573 domain-containing protein [Reichenbachiella versicolor]